MEQYQCEHEVVYAVDAIKLRIPERTRRTRRPGWSGLDGRATSSPHTAALLPEGKLRRIEAVAGTQITCVTGRLWITFAGDNGDYVLKPGDSFTAPRAGLLLAQALESTTYRLADHPHRHLFARHHVNN